MTKSLRRYIDAALNIAPHEWSRVMLCWFLKFLFYAAYTVAYTMLISMFVRRIGADHVHIFLVVLAVLSMIGNLVFLQFIHRASKSSLMIFLGVLVTAFLFVSSFVFDLSPIYGHMFQIVVFAMLFSQISICLVLFVESRFTPLESERTFPVIESAKTMGAVFGGLILSIFASRLGTPALVYIWGALTLLIVATLILSKYVFYKVPHLARSVQGIRHATHYNIVEGAKHIKSSRFLKSLALIVFVQWIVIELIEFKYTHIMGSNYLTEDGLSGKLGLLTLIISLLVFFVQIVLASRFMQKFGVIASFLSNAFMFVIGFVSLIFSPTLFVGFFAKLVSEAGLGIQENAYHTSFYVLQRRVRVSCKAILEGFIHPMGFVFGTLLIFFLEFVYGKAYLTAISVSALLLSILMIYLILRLRSSYTSLAKANVFSNDFSTRQDVIEILGERGHDKDSAALLARIAKDNKEPVHVRSSALSALGRLVDEYTLPELIDCLQDDDEMVRYEAAVALRNFGMLDKHFERNAFSRHRVLRVLKERFQVEPSRRVRDQIVYVLMALKDSSLINFLLDLIKSPEAHVRKDAARMVGAFSDSNIAYYLLPLLEDENPAVLAHTISAMWQFKKVRLDLMDPMAKLLYSGDQTHLKEGLKLLGRIDAPQEARLLEKYVQGDDEDLRRVAICSFIRRGDLRYVKEFVQQILSQDSEVSYHAMRVYGELEGRNKHLIEKELKKQVSHKVESIFHEKGSILDELPLNDLYRLRRLYGIIKESSEINQIDTFMRERCDLKYLDYV